MAITQELIGFIKENLVGNAEVAEIKEDDSLIERGLIDSMGLMQLMMFAEERAGIRIPDTEVTPENFDTVGDINRLIERLKNGD